MDAILQYLNATAAYASVVSFTILVGSMYILLTYPAPISIIAIILLIAYLRKNNRMRRLWCWHVWYPIQRSIHRLTVPARRRIVGYMMCKIKKSVLADKLDDCLREMVHDKHISYHEYQNLCARIGEALEISDLVPRGKRWKSVTDMIVRRNCAEMKSSVPAGLKIPGAPKPAEPKPPGLQFLRNRNAA